MVWQYIPPNDTGQYQPQRENRENRKNRQNKNRWAAYILIWLTDCGKSNLLPCPTLGATFRSSAKIGASP